MILIDSNTIVYDLNKKSINLNKLLKNELTLIIKLNDSDCSDCTDNHLKILKGVEIITQNKITPLFLGEFSSWHNFNYYKTKYKIENMFSIEPDKINLKSKNEIDLFLVLLDRELDTKFIYIPMKETPDITKHLIKYLNEY